MSVRMDSVELMALLAEVAEAFGVACAELEGLAELEFTMPDDWRRELEERDALAATLARVRAALPARSDELTRIYREEFAKAHRPREWSSRVPIDGETMAQLADTQEVLRRTRLVDSGLDEALRPVVG